MNYDKARRVIWWAIERLEELDDWLYLRRPTTFPPVAPLLPSMPELRFDQQSKVRKMTNNGEPIRWIPYDPGTVVNTYFVHSPDELRDVIEQLRR